MPGLMVLSLIIRFSYDIDNHYYFLDSINQPLRVPIAKQRHRIRDEAWAAGPNLLGLLI